MSQPPSPPIGISFKNLYDSCAATVAAQNAISPNSNFKQALSIQHCYRILKKVHAAETGCSSWTFKLGQLISPYELMVLVCGCRGRSLRRASNLYSSCSRTHWRRSWRLCCRSQRRVVDLALSRAALVGWTVEPEIQ